MLTFQVDDIHCGHCVRAIKDALRALDAAAAVDVDLGRRLVKVQSDCLDAARVRAALVGAGYSPDSAAIPELVATPVVDCCGCKRSRCGCADWSIKPTGNKRTTLATDCRHDTHEPRRLP